MTFTYDGWFKFYLSFMTRVFFGLLIFIWMFASYFPQIKTGFHAKASNANANNTNTLLSGTPQTDYPILFVTQVPVPADFTTIGSVFGNHRAALNSVARGGDLWIRYPDGTQKNLTAAAGYGESAAPGEMQGANAIAVRDPAMHWEGQKAIFSMVLGAPTEQYQVQSYYWQLYEITSFGQNETPVITKVANQPADFNNVSPIYGTPIYSTNDHIIFTSDRPRNGARHLYPQLDEYEEAPTVTGLWSLDPANGTLRLLNHAPSGDFTPILDSFGRVIFTQWDHLQRDQQADGDALGSNTYNTFNYSDESAESTPNFNDRTEVFPEPRADRTDLLADTNLNGHRFNHFLPWQIFEDGTESEILNHLGRHELHGYLAATLNDDANVVEYYGQYSRTNPNEIENMLQIKEDPLTAGRYYGIDAPEFGTHAAGQIIFLDAPPTVNADQVIVTYVTHRDTADASDTPSVNHSGLYRDPLPLSNGTVIVAHTAETRYDTNLSTRANPRSRYDFQLKQLVSAGNGVWTAGEAQTIPISETVQYWDPDVLVTYSGPLWQWQPIEVRPRSRPPRLTATLSAPEANVFAAAGVEPATLRAYLEANNLALIVSRNVTVRDDLDRQQPFNLRVPGGVQTIAQNGGTGKIYDVTHLQLFQADQLRGLRYISDTPHPGRRVLAQHLHDPAALAANQNYANGTTTLHSSTPHSPTADKLRYREESRDLVNEGLVPPPSWGRLGGGDPQSSVQVAPDGSLAAFVPAQRALTWQLTDADGTGVVRERNWLTFQPGEIRVCGSCHGLSDKDQAGQSAPTNEPQALRTLLDHWKADQDPNATHTSTPTSTPTATPTSTLTPVIQPTSQPTTTPTTTPTPKPTTAPPTLAGCTIFPGDNIWNTPIDDQPIVANSTAYIDTIGRDRTFHPDFGAGEWPPGSGSLIGIPFVTVPGDQVKVTVTFDYADESDPGPYPIPANAPIEGGPNSDGDRHILMLDQDNCLLYELFAAYPQQDSTWQAGSGAIFDLSSHALRPDTWTSADAAGLPILPGMLHYDEVASGEIRHAIRFTAPQTQRAYVWPARHHASDLTGSTYPPLGQRFRLHADFDIGGYSPQIQVILRAMQRYGIILADNGSAWYLSGAPDDRWDNDMLSELKQLTGNDFEAVDVSALMLDPDSGQVKQATSAPTILAGDGNGDGTVDAGDISACVLEIFDGDGTDPANAPNGSFAGTAGCDANRDGAINAGDISCSVLLIFNGANACGNTTSTSDLPSAQLAIGRATVATNEVVTVPIILASNGHAISAATFALDLGAAFDPTDENEDRLPDTVQLPALADDVSVTVTWQAGRLDVAIVDSTAPLSALPDGPLLTITLKKAVGDINGDTDGVLTFATSVPPSLGSVTGTSVSVATQNNNVPAVSIYLPLIITD